MKQKLIIGLVGEKGSGKETFGNYLLDKKSLSIERIRFSDLLKETLSLWDIPHTRENLQKIVVVMDNAFGKGTLSNAVLKRVYKLNANIIIIDGVRWLTDEEFIRKFPKNLMVYITANVKTRFERTKKRLEKVGEGKSYAQFLREEKAKNELLIGKIGGRADVKIENNESLKEFKEKVEDFYTKFIQP